jgi:hypothetical protein
MWLGGFAFGNELPEARVSKCARDIQAAAGSSGEVLLCGLWGDLGLVGHQGGEG